jgi:hypothetical protein
MGRRRDGREAYLCGHPRDNHPSSGVLELSQADELRTQRLMGRLGPGAAPATPAPRKGGGADRPVGSEAPGLDVHGRVQLGGIVEWDDTGAGTFAPNCRMPND